jgi:hypothetical protein
MRWLSWHRPYPFLERVRPLAEDHPGAMAILTTKDQETVGRLLKRHGPWKSLGKNVIGRESLSRNGGKKEAIESRMAQASYPQSLFVDDSREHLEGCRVIHNLVCLQAGWGYVRPGDEVSSQEEVLAAIGKLAPFQGGPTARAAMTRRTRHSPGIERNTEGRTSPERESMRRDDG